MEYISKCFHNYLIYIDIFFKHSYDLFCSIRGIKHTLRSIVNWMTKTFFSARLDKKYSKLNKLRYWFEYREINIYLSEKAYNFTTRARYTLGIWISFKNKNIQILFNNAIFYEYQTSRM